MINRRLILIISTTIAVFLSLSACADTDNDSKNKNVNSNSSKSTQNDSASIEDVEEKIIAPDETLQKKDQGDQVEQLQIALNKVGYNLDVTGVYDEATTWAITDFQLQTGDLMALGIYNVETKEVLNSFLKNDNEVEVGLGLPLPAEEVTTTTGIPVIDNPYDQLALINKEQALPEDYVPVDLVVPNVPFPFDEDLPKKQMRKVAATALEEMFEASVAAGLELYALSGYRSYETQENLFANYVSNHGEEEANIFSARPGESEHQTGLTMDVTNQEVGYGLTTDFGKTDEGKWLEEHAADFGFIIRFPEGKEDITKYQYEPWHVRYVGKKAAKEIMSEGITLEEYYLN